MTDERQAIVENAKYLREVRPIDPDEIYEYVASQPHPAVVRQVLREEAVALGLREREDGTFVPVSEEPVTATPGTVEALPETYADRLDDLLVDEYGPDWHDGPSGDLLRLTIRRLKDAYYRQHPVEYDREAALGYAIYHLPDNYAVVQYALADLTERGLVGRRLRVLDVGAGVGGPALGLHDLLADDALVEYHAVEPSAAADVLDGLLAETSRNFHPTIHRERAEAFDPESVLDAQFDAGDEAVGFDLIIFGNVLNELDDPVAVTRRYLDALAPDGSMVALAPADQNTSTGLRQVERALADEPAESQPPATVFSPTVRLWPGETPTDRGWSFDVRPDLAVPAFQRRLDEAADDADHDPGEFVNVDVQFSHSILRRDGLRKYDLDPEPDRYAKMAEMERHVSERIDLLAMKLSRSLSEGDANPLYKISDGSEATEHYAVLTRETSLNRDLAAAEYGDLLSIESALALWNDDEGAYNLVVDDETVIDRLVR
ncbi:Methyltransferase domain-containing protein [Natronoarchaeum philippinense]|uniref:Methyltransferase domain-containing protein n=1 Tax=Natronoarchaeum philippinense TaxID=558529 RepID=A0A285NUS0_NATPI|nr:methyltransferase [Natronoarchaeum philippinense]SNZ13189.1 Methyltransferase domain-containing protein [Natronoarchaeum philippinense]